MTHNKVPAVQHLILASLISTFGRNVELGTALFHNKAGLIPALLYLTFPSVSINLFLSIESNALKRWSVFPDLYVNWLRWHFAYPAAVVSFGTAGVAKSECPERTGGADEPNHAD